ncbi:hypothetical protein OH686_22485 [Pseudomonas sp. SO81]|nr:hypothetical protein OH686_22485 [Pseudomonas sp. SO81]
MAACMACMPVLSMASGLMFWQPLSRVARARAERENCSFMVIVLEGEAMGGQRRRHPAGAAFSAIGAGEGVKRVAVRGGAAS